MEFFIAWYSGNPNERFHFLNRAFGPYQWAWIMMVTCNVMVPQFFWFRKLRQNLVVVFIISILVNVGMWFERFVIIVLSLHRDFLPSSWGYYRPTWVDICTYIGTFGLFFTCFLLFHPVPADDRHLRGQGRHAAGRSRIIRLGGAKVNRRPDHPTE